MILVTGGAGFIGSNLVAALNENAINDVVVCDVLGTGEKWRNLAKRELEDLVRPEQLRDFLDARRGMIRAIFHLGAISATTERDVDSIVKNNVRLSIDLWEWCSRYDASFIYASSAATYGDGSQGFDDDASVEGLARLRPLNAYGWSKHLFDRRVARVIANQGACPPQWVGLKFFNVYGPNEEHKGAMKSVVAKIYPRVAAGESAVLFRSHNPDYPDGGQLRDFIYVRDCADAMMWFGERPALSGIFNLGTGRARTFADLARAVFEAVGREPEIEYIDTPEEIRAKYQYFTQAEMGRLRAAGYERPFTSLEDGVGEYVREYLSSADPFR